MSGINFEETHERDRLKQFDMITSSVRDAVIIIDQKGRITFWNKARRRSSVLTKRRL